METKTLGIIAIGVSVILFSYVMVKTSHNESLRRRKERGKDPEQYLKGD